jgi:hypothetical protein
MVISGNPDGIIASLHDHFLLKVVSDPGKEPDRYLGAMMEKYQFADGSVAWYMSTDNYLSKAIPTFEEGCDDKLYKKHESPLPPDYHPEVERCRCLMMTVLCFTTATLESANGPRS